MRDRLLAPLVIASELKERALRRLMPKRMRIVPYAWPLLPDVCPCDVHFSDYLVKKQIRKQAIFHFGTGGHHLVGLRNQVDALENDIFAITASPSEHARYVKLVIADPALGKHYKVVFADIYTLSAALLPSFDVVTLFHLCEFAASSNRLARLDDGQILELFVSKLAPGGRMIFYASSAGAHQTQALIDVAVRDGQLRLEDSYESLRVYTAAER